MIISLNLNMEITAEDRKMLNDIVDFQIQNMYQTIDFGNDEEIKKKLKVTNSYDFILGMMYTKTVDALTSYLLEKMKIGGTPTAEELSDIMTVASDVIIDRIPEIKQKVEDKLSSMDMVKRFRI